jgi:cephalosporin-C deacetylase-like acetyl esterase
MREANATLTRPTKMDANFPPPLLTRLSAGLFLFVGVCNPSLSLLSAPVTAPATAPVNGTASQKTAVKFPLTVTAEKADPLYHRGEEVRFIIQATGEGTAFGSANVAWTLSKDGLPPHQSGTLKLQDGRATVTGLLNEPGFLQCRVKLEGAAAADPVGGGFALGGAAVDPRGIKPSLPVPSDFNDYWSELKGRLAKVPMNPKLVEVASPIKNGEAFDLKLDSVGPPVSGYFVRPRGAAAKSLPAILTVHGAGVRSSSLGGSGAWAAQGFLALDINAHGLPNGEKEEFYKALADGELKDYRVRGRESRDTVYFQGMFLRLVRAIDFLTSQPEWDGKIMVVYGSSQGGAQSIVAAGLDSRVSFYAAGVPAMCDHTGYKVGRINGWPKFIATGETPDDSIANAVRYYDAMNFAAQIRVPGIMTVGFIDTTCPPTSVYAAFNAVNARKDMFDDPASGHTVSAKAGDSMRSAILSHVQQTKGR